MFFTHIITMSLSTDDAICWLNFRALTTQKILWCLNHLKFDFRYFF